MFVGSIAVLARRDSLVMPITNYPFICKDLPGESDLGGNSCDASVVNILAK
jgi:hypothetical protein